MLNVEYRQAITQVLDVLDNTDESLVKKIPNKFMDFLKQNKLDNDVSNLQYDKPLDEMNLMPKAKTILSIIYMKYWVSEKERQELADLQYENENIYQQNLKKKYSYDNLFKKNIENKNEATANIVKYEKENFLIRFFNRIINFFRKNK